MKSSLFFDFDGVIVESLSAKTRAFRKIYEPYGVDIQNKVESHHLAHGGVSRFEKFKHYHQEFLEKSLSETEVDNLAREFSQLVLEEVIKSRFSPGIISFLEKAVSKNLKIWVISGTPTDELRVICKSLKIDHYFEGIYGSPESKDYWCKKIIDEYKLNEDEITFFGDAHADLEAANKNSLDFILREHNLNQNLFKSFHGKRIQDFNDSQLQNWIL